MEDMKDQMARAIEMALAHELEAELFYTEASRLYDPGEARATFSFLAKEEAKHRQELAGRFRDLIEELGLREKTSPEAFMDDLRPRVEEKLSQLKLPELGSRDILELALSEERRAKDLYSLNASIFTEPKLKQLFSMLAKEEEEHIKTLKALLRLMDREIISPEQLVQDREAKQQKGRDDG
jgi:rubrerythrin